MGFVLSSLAIFLLRRKLVFTIIKCGYLCFVSFPRGSICCLQSVIVAFPGHIHLRFISEDMIIS